MGGCADTEVVESAGERPTAPSIAEQTYGPGSWSVAQRGVPMDPEDLDIVLDTETTVGITPEQLSTQFGRVVINAPYVDCRRTDCPVPTATAAQYQPKATVESFKQILDDRGIQFDEIAVNVDLLQPNRRGLQTVRFDLSGDAPRFDVAEHRDALIAAFEDLAEVDGIAYITVGLEMNRWYHLKDADGNLQHDDFLNFVGLYAEIYRAIKAKNSDIKVGPGISWAVFMNQMVPEMDLELRAEAWTAEAETEAVAVEARWRAWSRSVAPLLGEGNGNADFLAVSMIPFTDQAPFNGDPGYVGREEAMKAYFHELSRAGLPIVIPQIDWATQGGSKADFLRNVKQSTGNLDIEWAAWRRLSDLTNTEGASVCLGFTSQGFPEDYCSSGLFNKSGAARDVLSVFVNP